MINADLNFVRGNTFSRGFSIEGWKYDIDQVYFTMKENENDKNYVLQKRLEHGINLVEDGEDIKTYVLTIEATDTDDFMTNYDYYFDIKIISGTKKRTIIKGNVRLDTEIIKTSNEVI